MCVCVAEEEIDNMKSELDKYGIQMPAFNKIGGILANELSEDEAAGRLRRADWPRGHQDGEETNCVSHQAMRR